MAEISGMSKFPATCLSTIQTSTWIETAKRKRRHSMKRMREDKAADIEVHEQN